MNTALVVLYIWTVVATDRGTTYRDWRQLGPPVTMEKCRATQAALGINDEKRSRCV